MDNLFTQPVMAADKLFDSHYIDIRNLYLQLFQRLPDLHFMNSVDGEKAFAAFCEKYESMIESIHTYRWYKRTKKKYQFDRTIVILKNNSMVEFDDDYCEMLHNGRQPDFVQEVTDLVNQYKERQRKQPFEISLIVKKQEGLVLKPMEIKRTRLDLSLFYPDDFLTTDEIIRKRLSQKNDKGIVLLHGLPGTGKTTYLRYLIGKIKKRVLFLSPNTAGDLMDPGFIELMIANPNTVVVIEDAENIIMDRRHNSSSAVSNLLNISDGLLADFLNIQLICTFNSSLTMIDSALLRKGRLIARHEFGKLPADKAQRLSDHLGYNTIIQQPMTLAEISNQKERTINPEKKEIIGFKRAGLIEA